MIKLSNKKSITFLFFLFNFLISHFYLLALILINMLTLIVSHLRKEYQIKNYIGLYLFIAWRCCFYIYLHCFVNTVVDNPAFLL